jgi:hypothetical protein
MATIFPAKSSSLTTVFGTMSRKFTPKTCTRQHITKNKLNNLRNTQTVDARKGHKIFDEPVGVNVYPHTLKRHPPFSSHIFCSIKQVEVIL